MNTLQFLHTLRPDGPWDITAIAPDGVGIVTRTFGPSSVEKLQEFIKEHNGRRNLYYGVNPSRYPLRKKASKDDIYEVQYLHVDIDARHGEPLEEELQRLKELVSRKPPGNVPPPTFTIMTGGGYQLLWKLKEPIAADANAEAFNRALEQLYDADKCHDVCRIFRLPGTRNLPNAKKRARGRVATDAALTNYTLGCIYDVNKFPSAEPSTASGGHRGGELATSSPQPTSDLAALDLPDRVKVIIAQGHDPEAATKDGKDVSSSGWVWDATCNMVRAGLSDAVVLGILLDRGWGISEHIYSQRDPEGYARRQLTRAKEAIADDFELNDKGIPKPNQHNVRVALRRLGVRLSHDQFADRLMIEGLPGHGPVLQDDAVKALYLTTEQRFGFRPGKDYYWMVVENEARHNGYNPVVDYLDGLAWDGTPRLDTWLATYCGAHDSPYTQAVGRLPLLAAVRRARRPGCKFDEMLVLRSPQGTGKSTALAALCPDPDWFSDDLPLDADSKVAIERLRGRWIVEAAELTGLRQSKIEHMKAFLSRQVDRARMAYGRLVTEVPRQCVFVGTTNSDRFLRDTTGDRRFWPVLVGEFDLEGLNRDRDQLWAEAAQREAAGESVRLDPSLYEVATEEQEEHRIEDPFEQTLAEALGDLEGKLRAVDAWELTGVQPGQRTQEHNARLGAALRRLGWERTKRRFDGGKPEWSYVRGEGDEPLVVRRDEFTGRWNVLTETQHRVNETAF